MDEEVAHEEEEAQEQESVTDAATEDGWELLERIGAYAAGAAGELSGEEAREAERFVLKNAEASRLAASYARMLTLLRAIGEELPEVAEAVINHALRQAVGKARACHGHVQRAEKGQTRCTNGRPEK